MAKVTFDCGAEVVLQGPCDFVVQRPDGRRPAIRTDYGQRAAPAFSFAILSPQVDFVDLGTSFGVAVGGQRANRASCVRRRSAVQPVGTAKWPAQGSDPRHGEQRHGVRDLHRRAQRHRDGRRTVFRADRLAAQPIIKLDEHITENKLALWLAADVAVTTDDRQRVISWQDIVYGDNKSAEDAVQAD